MRRETKKIKRGERRELRDGEGEREEVREWEREGK